jgi:hypothetical protein
MNDQIIDALKGKRSKAEVKYVDKSSSSSHCAICKHFLPPLACEGVAGAIDPKGWCTRYARK